MADGTSIEWTAGPDGTPGATWNPVRGCSRISPGCGGANHMGGCYAEKIAARFSDPGMAFHGFAERTAHGGRWTGKVAMVRQNLDMPLRWKRQRTIFVNSTSDLFHEALTDEDIAAVFGVCVAAHHLNGHRLIILTKRSQRMRETLNKEEFWEQVNDEAESHVLERVGPHARRKDDARATLKDYGPSEPPPGIWLGVSIEDRKHGVARAVDLACTPATFRLWSCEPLLEDLGDLTKLCLRDTGIGGGRACDLAIAGGESGPNSRPFDVFWARSIIRQCRAAGVACFVKQLGANPVADGRPLKLKDRKGGDMAEWPEDLRVRELPT